MRWQIWKSLAGIFYSLTHPAGRIPSDKGYRLYVDMLMQDKEQEVTEIKEQMLQKADKMDQLLKQAARVLANSTNYATMVSAPVSARRTG